MIVIGGGVIGLELGSVWSRLGAEVSVVEFNKSIGAGMDGETAYFFTQLQKFIYLYRKNFQKIMQKQGIKFRLSTKVISAKKNAEGKVDVVVEPSAGGPQETVPLPSL